jgi:hypothetical protein
VHEESPRWLRGALGGYKVDGMFQTWLKYVQERFAMADMYHDCGSVFAEANLCPRWFCWSLGVTVVARYA